MKIETAKMDSEVHGEIQTSGFTIKADAFMFDTLFAGLYKDPMIAAIREIVSNAYDANPSKPFHVQLPSIIDKTFSVRDFGEGMSHDFVMKLYTMAGHSNKRNTNDLVGGYGIGSKSPLAYTNSFNIISIHEGIRSVYNVYRQEDGLPVISCFASEKTNEPSGVEVSFSVSAKDVNIFNDKAKQIFFGFFEKDSYPIILENDYKANKKTPLFSTTFEKHFKGKKIKISGYVFESPYSVLLQSSKYQIRMGCVLYPVKYIAKSASNASFSNNKVYIIDVNVGEFKITRSRDSLILNDEDNDLIYSSIRELENKFAEKTIEEFKDCKNIEDILEKGIELNKIDFVKDNFFAILNLTKVSSLETEKIVASLTRPRVSNVKTKGISDIFIFDIFNNMNNFDILVCNSTTRIPSRSAYFHKNKSKYKHTVFIPDETQIPKRIWNIFKNYFEIYYTEDFDPPRTKTTKIKTYKKGMVQFLKFRDGVGYLNVKKDIGEITQGKFLCVPTRNNKVELNLEGFKNNDITLNCFMALFGNFFQNINEDYEVVAVSPLNMKKFPENVEVKDFNDFVLSTIYSNEDVYTDLNFGVCFNETYKLKYFINDLKKEYIKECLKYKTEKNQEIISFLERILKMKNAPELPTRLLINYFSTSKLPEYYKHLTEKYTLFRFFDKMTIEEMKFYLQNLGETK